MDTLSLDPDIFGPTQAPAAKSARANINPGRKYQPLNIQAKTPARKKKFKLHTDQIVAIVLVGVILVGVLFMILAFVGVFDETGATVNLTPSLTPPSAKDLPVTVTVA